MIASRMFRRLVLPSLALVSLPALLPAESLEGVPVEVVARRKVVLADRTVVYLRIRPRQGARRNSRRWPGARPRPR